MRSSQRSSVHCQILLAGLLVAGCGTDAESDLDRDQVEFELEGQPLTFGAGVARQLGSKSGQSNAGPLISGYPQDESAWATNNIALAVPTLDPRSWEYDGARSKSAGSARYPRLDLVYQGTNYRCYPGIAPIPSESEPVGCRISITGRAEHVTGTFSGMLAEVGGELVPTGKVVAVARGEFDVPELHPPRPDDGEEE